MAIEQALLFAGQGAQFVGMGRDLAEAYPDARALFSKANDILGYDLARLCFEGHEDELVKSSHCQPAIFVVSAVCYLALRNKIADLTFNGAAGLSLGEWSALYIAGSVSFENAVRILSARGQFMQEACDDHDGAMLSVIGLSSEILTTIAENSGVEIANLNSPQQTVLSGERKLIQEVEKFCMNAGAKRTVMLNVAGAYHSSLMETPAKRIKDFMKDMQFKSPNIPVLSNVTGQPHSSPDEIKQNMILQITSPVQWVSCIRWFQNNGVSRYIECGPGRVLTGLAKRIHSGASLYNIQDIASLDKTVAMLSQ